MTAEDKLQCAVAELLDYYGWHYCHVPNGGHRHKAVAAKLKAMGVKRGVPDVLIFERWEDIDPESTAWSCWSFGIAIELKVGPPQAKRKTYPDAKQREWMAALQERGWRVAVCRSVAEVKEVLQCVRPMNGRRIT